MASFPIFGVATNERLRGLDAGRTTPKIGKDAKRNSGRQVLT